MSSQVPVATEISPQIEACVDSLITWDQAKRDLMKYKDKIKDSFGWVL